MIKNSSVLLKSRSIVLLVCACFAGLLGCERSNLPKTVKAEGVVTLDGTPVANATISFISEKHQYHATGNTDANGKFAMRAFPSKTGAVPGDYRVELMKSVAGDRPPGASEDEPVAVNLRNELPSKYASMTTSQLTASVPEAGTNQLLFELTSK